MRAGDGFPRVGWMLPAAAVRRSLVTGRLVSVASGLRAVDLAFVPLSAGSVPPVWAKAGGDSVWIYE